MITDQKKLYYRQKVLLALLQIFGGKVPNVDFQKYLFLYTQLGQDEKSYEFVPYKYGCFSFQSYTDRRKLIEFGFLKESDIWEMLSEEDFFTSLKQEDQKKLSIFKAKFGSLSGQDLVREVYKRFPYYATRSEIAEELMSKQDMSEIKKHIPTDATHCFFTIGYEGSPFENYLNRLIKNNVTLLVDVRKNPVSRKYGFSQKTLSETLEKLDIAYAHFPQLGIISDKRKVLNTHSDYDRLFNEYENTILNEQTEALDKLYELFLKYKRIAITCFEADVSMCHRGRVSEAFRKRPDWNYKIQHI